MLQPFEAQTFLSLVSQQNHDQVTPLFLHLMSVIDQIDDDKRKLNNDHNATSITENFKISFAISINENEQKLLWNWCIKMHVIIIMCCS